MVLYKLLRMFTFTPDMNREGNATCVIDDGLIIMVMPEGIAKSVFYLLVSI